MKKYPVQRPHLSAILAGLLAFAAQPVFAHDNAHKPETTVKAPVSKDEHAFGQEGELAQVKRTIYIDMNDNMRFSPSDITVRQGETIRFIVRNKGRAMHEMVIGTQEELKTHGALMKQNPGMEHDAPYMAHVAPGAKQDMLWKFTKAGEFHFGCLAPGHFEAGMIGKITVNKG